MTPNTSASIALQDSAIVGCPMERKYSDFHISLNLLSPYSFVACDTPEGLDVILLVYNDRN